MALARLLLLLLAGLWTITAAALPPSPLPQSYVSDTEGLLAADTRRELDRLARLLHDSGRGEIGFLVVRSTGGVDPRRYGTEVFNAWGIGHRDRNDGTLILLAREDRAAEIILGGGIDDARHTRIAEAVMQREMVPRFRNGDYDQGLVAGTGAWLREAHGLDLSRPSEAPLDAGAPVAASPLVGDGAAEAGVQQPSRRSASGDSSSIAIGLGVLLAVLSGFCWILYKLLSGLWWLLGSRLFPRRCRRCQRTMEQLGEAEDDSHLTPAQLSEERVRSVDYRVFRCPGCGSVDILQRQAWFSRYSPCPACSARTVSSTSDVISAATIHSAGLARVTSTCQHCHDTRVSTRVIPQQTPSSSGSGRGFGGGSSRGGGASGRW